MFATKYKCFHFNEVSLFDKNIGPAYKEDIFEDKNLDNGLNSLNSSIIKVKVTKINAIINDEKIEQFWYNPNTGVIYDLLLYYPVGKIQYDDNNIPIKFDKNTYKVDIINIPLIK